MENGKYIYIKKILEFSSSWKQRKKKYWSRNLKWATAHLSIGWAGRKARGTARAQGSWARRGLGAGAAGRQARARARALGRASATGRHAGSGAGARDRQTRGSHRTGAGRAGWPLLCTWCTQPVFDPV